ncbi:hypothetical protein AVEN_184889-1 [Araneus ventricosus]|uniref:Uncharacterized protein n=1 Tax=Araneus ventricosus TaxID=182803 RepID=A0A4Y2GFL4_ARAVE|nr:hypothetical protein AVEN_184889-1 [Araneus ventricosus]
MTLRKEQGCALDGNLFTCVSLIALNKSVTKARMCGKQDAHQKAPFQSTEELIVGNGILWNKRPLLYGEKRPQSQHIPLVAHVFALKMGLENVWDY